PMRRMRDLTWQYGLYAIPAVAAAFGLQYLIRTHHSGHSGADVASAMKPSFFKADSAGGTTKHAGGRAVASLKGDGGHIRTKEDLHPGEDEASDGESSQEGSSVAESAQSKAVERIKHEEEVAEASSAGGEAGVKTQELHAGRETASEKGGAAAEDVAIG